MPTTMSVLTAAKVPSNTEEMHTLPSLDIRDIRHGLEMTADISELTNAETVATPTINVTITKKKIRRSEVTDTDYNGLKLSCVSSLTNAVLEKARATAQRNVLVSEPSVVLVPTAEWSAQGLDFYDTEEDRYLKCSFPIAQCRKRTLDFCTPSTSKKRRVSNLSEECRGIPLTKLRGLPIMIHQLDLA
ncbi:hypothetical protein CHS0354_036327 [Potamilus streckersoni]|uniref:Uncharacterized protein n=1 Tax=Potamilus streckersoni TaxID=2493646 RepID=A0AAE0RMD0_9BIVA|nr:hypothetical protein CHS0354_036327 [Potamilus streckersoni]